MAGRYGPPTPLSVRRANLVRDHSERSGILGGIAGVAKNFGREVGKYGRNLPKGVGALGSAVGHDQWDMLHGRPAGRTSTMIKNAGLSTLSDIERLIPTPKGVPRFMQAGIAFNERGIPHFAGPSEMQRLKGDDVGRAREFVTKEPLTAALTASTFFLPVASRLATRPVAASVVRGAERTEKASRPFVAANLAATPPPRIPFPLRYALPARNPRRMR